MEIHQRDLIDIHFDKKKRTERYALNKTGDEKVEVWQAEELLANSTVSDVKFFVYYCISAILTVFLIFTFYTIVDTKVAHHWGHAWLMASAIVILSVAISFGVTKVLALLIKWVRRRRRSYDLAEFYQFHDKVSTIEVEHYDYVRLDRPDEM